MSAPAALRQDAAYFEVFGNQCYQIKAGATCAALLDDGLVLLDSAHAVMDIALDLQSGADFAVVHLTRQAHGLASAAAELIQGGGAELARPRDFFVWNAGYQAGAGTTLVQLLQDAHALASSAHGVWADLSPTTDARFAVLHLLAQAKGVLSWAAALAEEGARVAVRPSC